MGGLRPATRPAAVGRLNWTVMAKYLIEASYTTEGPGAFLVLLLLAASMMASRADAETHSEAQPRQPHQQVIRLEEAYADFNDASGAVSLIDSNPGVYLNRGYAGKSRQVWQQIYIDERGQLTRSLESLPLRELSAGD